MTRGIDIGMVVNHGCNMASRLAKVQELIVVNSVDKLINRFINMMAYRPWSNYLVCGTCHKGCYGSG